MDGVSSFIENFNHNGSTSGRSTPSTDSPLSGKLFMGGLSWQTTPEKLKEYFGQFGSVTDVLVMKDPVTQRSRGFGFITFTSSDSVDRVLAVPTHTLDGKRIDPKPATPKSKSRANKTKKIFVGGVSQETTADDVKAYFSQFGKVEETVMLMDQQTKRHRGFGFVTFENEDIVDSVCQIHFHTIKNKKVECKKAQPKEAIQTPNSSNILGKRVILNSYGMTTSPNTFALPGLSNISGLPVIQSNQSFISMAPNQSQAFGGYGKLMQASIPGPHMGVNGALPTMLASYRYSPYQLPSSLANSQAAQAQVAALMAQTNHDQSYSHQKQRFQSQPTQAGLQQSISNTLTLGPNTAIATVAPTGHLSTMLPTVTMSPGLSAASGVSPAMSLAMASSTKNASTGNHSSHFQQNPFQGYNLSNMDMTNFQVAYLNNILQTDHHNFKVL